ncbi:multidrug ABC transporter permease/ATP-binding protein [Oenococcus oeni]|uniref:ABC transporter ATP-binding protein n=1 Tax=Oenococcus oeni TaxID=1247 RepID=UPI0008F866D2|nr:ABC transporter transmembrane domain-containing protein [Oenococcus oeni]OIM23740.1 multidrug ABC transporter permease/ATP-binding protein [Oenococcus oeni]
MGIFIKLKWFFKENLRMYAIGLLLLFLTDLSHVVPPYMIGLFTNEVVDRKITWIYLLVFLSILALIYLLSYLFRYGWNTHIIKGAALLERTLRKRLYDHYMEMDAPFYQKYRTGDLMSHASNDLSAIQRVASGGILMAFDSSVSILLVVASMIIFVDWRLTLIAIVPLPFLAVGVSWIMPRLRRAFTQYQEGFSKMSDHAQESFLGMKVIKTLGQSKEDIQAFNEQTDRQIRINARVARVDSMFDPLATIIMTFSYVLMIILGSEFVLHKTITIGQLVSFTAYLSQLVWPMFALGQLFNVLERGNASYDRVMDLMNEKSLIHDDPRGVSVVKAGELNIRIKSFNYPDDPKAVLKNIDIKVPKGKTLGLVGPVGSGKTTILRLLLREFDSYDGEIDFSGHDIRDYRLSSYLKKIGYVSQNNFLFSTNIAKNIAFSDPDLPQNEVEKVAKLAALHDDIMQMPKQYNTEVGENGISLSGGQQQRVAIARALIVSPAILILDDALSAVDARTEKDILNALQHQSRDQTTIISASRISSIINADEILVFQHGKIIERGTHHHLLAQNGYYAKTFHQQEMASHYEAKLTGGD